MSLFQTALTLVRMEAEDKKPSPQRLREFRDSARESLVQQLFSPAPVYKDLEQAKLADLLGFMVEQRGGDDPLVQQVLAGKSPRTRAAELVQGTRLDDVEFRRQLAAEGGKALASCDDPMIQLAKLVDPESRQIRDSTGDARRGRTSGLCPGRRSHLRDPGHVHLSGRHVYAAVVLRHGQGLRAGG